ncbi:MAG TPA: hypothetical protein VIJ73_21735, partial [Methylomirabilota bacterium]
TLLRSIIMALLVLSASVAWAAECAPEKMVRIVTRDATPGIDPQSFAALPKTLYRIGNARGRVEEMPDAARGVHGLIVVNEPDAWVVNLHDKSGRHVVDPGPGLIFRARILDGGELPSPLRELEFGCELAFVQAYAPKPDERVDAGGGLTLDKHQLSRGDHRVAILVHPKDRGIYAVAHYKAGKIVRVVRYVEYQPGLALDARLFSRPDGIQFAAPRPRASR